jgi:hypothetical protein
MLDQRRVGWDLEDFVDLVLEGEAGYIANVPNDAGLITSSRTHWVDLDGHGAHH